MNKQALDQLYKLHGMDLAYNAEAKAEYHRLARRYLKYIAKLLGLPKGSFDVRSNMGGIAVSGEVTLHTDDVYVQLSPFPLTFHDILIRTCKGRKDFTGGQNQWLPCSYIPIPFRFAEEVARVMAESRRMKGEVWFSKEREVA